jgi:MarR family transcriptional regulator, transcriptional regulator for hemolysin
MSQPAFVQGEAGNPRLGTGFALADVTRLLRVAFDQRMRTLGLTGSTWRVIAYLAREDGLTQAALAERLEISRVALGETVDRLEKSGHVQRRADPADRRKWQVHLTALSQEILPVMFKISDELQARCFADLSDNEIRQLEDALMRMRSRLLEMNIETPEDEAGQ